MSKPKFTPGPYLVNAEPGWYGLEARFFTVTNGEGVIVAFCKDWMDGPEPEANAKLFSIAPDLLADLKLAAQTLRRYEQSHRAKGTEEGTAKAEVNAELATRFEATIAKATA